MDRFTVEILPVVVRFAAVCFNCPDLQSLTLTLAWFNWNRATPEQQLLPASVWARVGVRWVKAKRDLPGVGGSARDAMNWAEQGGAMEELTDRYPGPEQIAMDRERYATVKSLAVGREREMMELFEAGVPGKDVAVMFGISQTRITQIRQRLVNRAE